MTYNVTDSADIASKGVARISNSISKQGKQAPVLHGNLLLLDLG